MLPQCLVKRKEMAKLESRWSTDNPRASHHSEFTPPFAAHQVLFFVGLGQSDYDIFAAYAAPEMLLSNSYVGGCVDVWSCGVVLYYMLTGLPPFATVARLVSVGSGSWMQND